LLALGVVFGDIGTSPLYALKETFNPQYGIDLTPQNIIGGCSTIFWALMIVVTLKYVTLLMRANNNGEGGILALLALATTGTKNRRRLTPPIVLLGLIGVSLFYGDAVLTPAISVLSAIEGLEIGTSALKPYIVPVAIAVLVALFAFQRHGTAVVGALFGPVCLLWFFALATIGVYHIVQHPVVLHALNPIYAFAFVTGHGFTSFLVLGAVVGNTPEAFAGGGAEAAWGALSIHAMDIAKISKLICTENGNSSSCAMVNGPLRKTAAHMRA